MILRTLYVFLRRDRLLHWSYRTDWILNLLSILLTVTTFFYVGKVLGSSASPAVAAYGGNYFPFVLIGIAFSGYQRVGLQAMARKLREEQLQGTLEQILSTPISPLLLLIASTQWELIQASVEIALYFCVAMLFFGFKIHAANLPAALLILILTLSTFGSLGMHSAAFVLKFKRGDPASWLIDAVSELLGGVYFPIAVLPVWMSAISRLIPMTHALEGLRLSLLAGAPWSAVAPSAFYLAVFTGVLFPSGIFSFRLAAQSAIREGSLGHY